MSRMMITVIIMFLIVIFNVTCRASTFQALSSFLTVHCKSWRGQEQLELYRNQNRFSDCAVSETHGHQNCFPCCFFLSAGSPAGPSVTPHLFFGHSAAFRLWLMAQPRLERPVPNWWFNIYIRVACHHLIKSTSDFLQLLIIRTIQFSVSILIPFNFFLSCYTSQVLGSCQKPRFRFAVTTLLFFVFPAMAAGYIAPYYPSTTEEEVAGRWTPIFGEEGYVDPWPLTLQKDGFWLNSIKEGITCLKSWSICNA